MLVYRRRNKFLDRDRRTAEFTKQHASSLKTLLEYIEQEKEVNEKILGITLNTPGDLAFALTGQARAVRSDLPDETHYQKIIE